MTVDERIQTVLGVSFMYGAETVHFPVPKDEMRHRIKAFGASKSYYELEQAIKQLITEELERVSAKFDELHQGTPGAGYVHYGEFGEYLDDRIATLKKELNQ